MYVCMCTKADLILKKWDLQGGDICVCVCVQIYTKTVGAVGWIHLELILLLVLIELKIPNFGIMSICGVTIM